VLGSNEGPPPFLPALGGGEGGVAGCVFAVGIPGTPPMSLPNPPVIVFHTLERKFVIIDA